MAVSKNNPNIRARQKLMVYCPKCEGETRIVKRVGVEKDVPSGMYYVCTECSESMLLTKGSYKHMNYKWVNK